MTAEHPEQERKGGGAPEDQPGEVGAEGGSESARNSKLTPLPDEGDDSAFGDTDQHSDA
jgi:hypothetical protein